jgi:hypothetical protein
MTCISIKASRALLLKPTRTATVYGAGGRRDDHPVFGATIHIPITTPIGDVVDVFSSMETVGLPDLELHTRVAYGGASIEIVGLLGRDILRFTQFLYNGLVDGLSIRFNIAMMKAAGIGGTTMIRRASEPKAAAATPAPTPPATK